MENAGSLITRQLYRKLLPLIVNRFMRFKEKHGTDKEGFVMELKRLNVLDEPEMERITHGYFLSKEPTLVWLIEWTLIYEMRKLFELYGEKLDFPYVVVNPYKFLGHLFQVIASQWLMTQGADMSLHEMDRFLKECLREHLERNVPITPHVAIGVRQRDWRAEMLQLHQRLWSDFPDLRPYIRYHESWFNNPTPLAPLAPPAPHPPTNDLLNAVQDLVKILAKSSTTALPLPPAPPPATAAAPSNAPLTAKELKGLKEHTEHKEHKEHKEQKGRKESRKGEESNKGGKRRNAALSSSESDTEVVLPQNTITARLRSDDDEDEDDEDADDNKRRISTSASSGSESE